MKLMTLILLLGFAPHAANAAATTEPSPPGGSGNVAQEKSFCPDPVPVCDGVADDTCALQTMLYHNNPEMTVVEIPATPTGCRITGPLFVDSNTHVIQNGLLTLDYDWPVGRVDQRGMYSIVDEAHDVIIEGGGILDGGTDHTTPPDGCCMGGIVSGGPAPGTEKADVSDITVRGLTLRNMPQWGVALTGATRVRIDGVTVYNTRASSGVGLNSYDAIVTNSRFYDIIDICFALYRGVDDAIISGTIVNRCVRGSGLSVFSDWSPCLGQPRFSHNVVLNNNIAIGENLNTSGGGLDVSGNDGVGRSNESTSITFSIAHSQFLGGIGMGPARGGLIAGNLTHDHGRGKYLGYAAGISLSGAQGVLVSGNSSYSQGYASTTGLGLYADVLPAEAGYTDPCQIVVPPKPEYPLTYLAVLDNYYYEGNATPTMLNGIKGTAANPVVVAGNTYAPLIGASDDMIYGATSIHTDNDAQP